MRNTSIRMQLYCTSDNCLQWQTRWPRERCTGRFVRRGDKYSGIKSSWAKLSMIWDALHVFECTWHAEKNRCFTSPSIFFFSMSTVLLFRQLPSMTNSVASTLETATACVLEKCCVGRCLRRSDTDYVITGSRKSLPWYEKHYIMCVFECSCTTLQEVLLGGLDTRDGKRLRVSIKRGMPVGGRAKKTTIDWKLQMRWVENAPAKARKFSLV